jgi:hypothetical protein
MAEKGTNDIQLRRTFYRITSENTQNQHISSNLTSELKTCSKIYYPYES